MPIVVKDRVKVSTTTTGTGPITLGAAAQGFQDFTAVGDGNETYYAFVGGADYEVGIGTFSLAGGTLSRDTVLDSTNSGSLVDWPAGDKEVFVTYPADKAVTLDTAQTLTNKTIAFADNTLTDVAGTTATQTLINKTIAFADNTLTNVVGTTATQTLTNKTISGASNTLTVDGSQQVGFRQIPQNLRSANYTLVAADAGKHIFHPAADTTNRTFNIPANGSVAFPIGTAITFINQNGSGGLVFIAITSDTIRLAGSGNTATRTLARNGVATAIKITATEWIISGVGLT